jgi:gamma-glutamylaminecyclotransferase
MSEPEAAVWDVFVYGTLRQGFYNHGFLRGGGSLGPARTRDGYAMYLSCGIPALVRDRPGMRIVGELYRVDAGILAGLDRLEEHPRVYRREVAPIVLADGRSATAWIYFSVRPRGLLADTGDFATVAGSAVLSRI